jgi:hypothetical protein
VRHTGVETVTDAAGYGIHSLVAAGNVLRDETFPKIGWIRYLGVRFDRE